MRSALALLLLAPLSCCSAPPPTLPAQAAPRTIARADLSWPRLIAAALVMRAHLEYEQLELARAEATSRGALAFDPEDEEARSLHEKCEYLLGTHAASPRAGNELRDERSASADLTFSLPVPTQQSSNQRDWEERLLRDLGRSAAPIDAGRVADANDVFKQAFCDAHFCPYDMPRVRARLADVRAALDLAMAR